MALATWWVGDPFEDLPPKSDFHVRPADDAILAQVAGLTCAEEQERRRAGHRPYASYIGATAVAYGWVATREAAIGELGLAFSLPPGDRYLWDFATIPDWQVRGLYPRLLQAIVRAEQSDLAHRFWIIHAPENRPSGAGMQKAGFEAVGQLSFRPDGRVGLIPLARHNRAQAGAALLGVPLLDDGLSPCWRCMDRVVCTCKLDPERCNCAVPIRAHT
jgi:RimJ/RimL family protein N-acetyltransferase